MYLLETCTIVDFIVRSTHFFQFLSIQAIAIKITIICNMSLNKKKIQQFFLLLKNKLFKLIIKWVFQEIQVDPTYIPEI